MTMQNVIMGARTLLFWAEGQQGKGAESTDQYILGWFLGNSQVACYVQKDLEDTLQTEPFLWNSNSGENLDLVRVKMK